MKCPIKNLESDCIQGECPLYKIPEKMCGLRVKQDCLEEISESLGDITLAMDGRE